MKPKEKTTCGTRSIERFNHFRCGSCDKWWGIGDAPEKRKEWYCPWCGAKNIFSRTKKRQKVE